MGNTGQFLAWNNLHEEHPDYPFAAIALAQFAAGDGEFQRARDLLAPCFEATQLHTSEAIRPKL